MTNRRGYADDLELMTWLTTKIFPCEGKWVGPEFVEQGASVGSLSADVKNGDLHVRGTALGSLTANVRGSGSGAGELSKEGQAAGEAEVG